MKKSRNIQLAALSILGMAACSSKQAAPDPCRPETYNDIACQDAVKNQGYYSHGVFVYGNYTEPYLSYYQRYQAFTAHGGVPHSEPLDAFTSRGGFGDSAHGAGA
jgi:hypothetical protein